MIRNADGSRISAETAAEIMRERFAASRNGAPYLSDVLGSDWGLCVPHSAFQSPENYEIEAYRIARIIYPDDGGHLYPRGA